MLMFTLHTQPIPKARARVGQHGAYTPVKTSAYEQAIGYTALQAMLAQEVNCFHEPIKVSMKFYRQGKIRVDLDNLIKSVLDGLNGVAYQDDHLIEELSATLEKACLRGKVEIKISTKGLDNGQG